MTDFTLKQQNFVKDEIPTRLRHLAANLSEIKSLFAKESDQETILRKSVIILQITARNVLTLL